MIPSATTRLCEQMEAEWLLMLQFSHRVKIGGTQITRLPRARSGHSHIIPEQRISRGKCNCSRWTRQMTLHRLRLLRHGKSWT